jgi:hypothetical protein
MKSFLGIGVAALALTGVATQEASAWGELRFGCGFDFCWQHMGQRGHRRHGCGGDPASTASAPGSEQQSATAQPQPQPPPGGQSGTAEATSLQWGYPNLNYSYFHPVSYYPPPNQPSYAPATNYSPPYYPPASSYPNYYPPGGVTFDR